MEALFLQSGGDIRDDAMKRIRQKTIVAFMEAAEREGLTSTWHIEMKTKTPADFNKMLAHRNLMLSEPDFEMIDVCLGCGKPESVDCGCPAGTGTQRRRKVETDG